MPDFPLFPEDFDEDFESAAGRGSRPCSWLIDLADAPLTTFPAGAAGGAAPGTFGTFAAGFFTTGSVAETGSGSATRRPVDEDFRLRSRATNMPSTMPINSTPSIHGQLEAGAAGAGAGTTSATEAFFGPTGAAAGAAPESAAGGPVGCVAITGPGCAAGCASTTGPLPSASRSSTAHCPRRLVERLRVMKHLG
ncbi:hypothetical protein [Hymenobacter daeguensis]